MDTLGLPWAFMRGYPAVFPPFSLTEMWCTGCSQRSYGRRSAWESPLVPKSVLHAGW